MRRNQPLTDQEVLDINRLADKGVSVSAISRRLGIARSTVSRELNADWTVERLVEYARTRR